MKKSQILTLAGSPRRNGNTDILLDAFLEGANEKRANIDKIIICQLQFKPCQECNSCFSNRQCIVDDDMQMVYPKIWEADIIVLASPIFFVAVSAYSKMLIDRCQCLWARKYVLKEEYPEEKRANRFGVFLSTAGSRNPGIFEGAIKTVKSFYDVCEVTYHQEILRNLVDEKGDINNYPETLTDAKKLCQNLVDRTSNLT